MHKRLLLALVLLLTAVSVAAQILPTDVDLRTAYCLRVKQRQTLLMNEILGSYVPGSPAYEVSQKVMREHASEIHRLQSYLVPRVSSLDATGLIAATNRGDADMNELASNPPACPDNCGQYVENGRPTDKWSACMDACLANVPAHARVTACKKVDWLPF